MVAGEWKPETSDETWSSIETDRRRDPLGREDGRDRALEQPARGVIEPEPAHLQRAVEARDRGLQVRDASLGHVVDHELDDADERQLLLPLDEQVRREWRRLARELEPPNRALADSAARCP